MCADMTPPESGDAHVPVVAMGASAGGLNALREVLAEIPKDSGACYVVIQHLDPTHRSMLTELLGRSTELPVGLAEDGAAPVANTVVVITEDATLTLEHGRFRVQKPAPPRAVRMPIDAFFESLATEWGERGVVVLLSGAGSDGTQGARLLKEAGGYVIAQLPESAAYDAMPRNVIATGLVDKILAPAQMPEAITEYLVSLHATQNAGETPDAQTRRLLVRICQYLKLATGHDFRNYKEPTLRRRVQRRMQVRSVTGLSEYSDLLRLDETEAVQLFRELLISVTAFFRDPDAFAALETAVETIVRGKGPGEPIRVWVAGCASGEEAYSLAILLREKTAFREHPPKIHIFATDIDEHALAVARAGTYPESVASYVPQPYLERYFRQHGNEYKVVDEIREMCIFSVQSLIKDPPFSRLDLLSCRNVMIYLKPDLQTRLAPIFHYALRPGGYLMLGPSESIGGQDTLFDVVDKKWRLFRRRPDAPDAKGHFPLTVMTIEGGGPTDMTTRARVAPPRNDLLATARSILLDELAPAYAIVSERRELVYSGGPIGNYLKMQPGAASLELFGLARSDLRMDLRALWRRVTDGDATAVRDRVSYKDGDRIGFVRITARQFRENASSEGRYYLFAFHDLGDTAVAGSEAADAEAGPQVQALQADLQTTREYLQTITEELESSNEELQSANEELMSMNEELQSSNEELETSKEELQSVNEELETVNTELSSKVDELARSNSDLANLLAGTDIATLFLDRDARVRRFTPVAKRVFNLIEADVGRPIGDIAARVADIRLTEDVATVLNNLQVLEREVSLFDGSAVFQMRILPYRSPGNMIDGVVVTFVDITRLKAASDEIDDLNAELEGQVASLQAILDIAPIAIAFTDGPRGSRVRLNSYGQSMFGLGQLTGPPRSDEGAYTIIQDGRELSPDELPSSIVWRTGEVVEDLQARFVGPSGAFDILMSAAPIKNRAGETTRVVTVTRDISALTAARAVAEQRAEQQAFVARLGGRSVAGMEPGEIIAELPDRLAVLLKCEFAKVLRVIPGTRDLEMVSAHGFSSPVGTRVDGGMMSQAGYTINVQEPVIVTDLSTETRFTGPALLTVEGIVSGMSVVIGSPDDPFGVIGVHSRRRRTFSARDAAFLQATAHILAAALRREQADQQKRLLLEELRHRVKNMLATVQSVIRLSLRDADLYGEVGNEMMERVRALALAHDLNFRREDQSIDIAELIRIQTQAYDPDSAMIEVTGECRVALPPKIAIDASMVIHELVTNAVKHGALSQDGRVEIALECSVDPPTSVVDLVWQEFGTPTGGSKQEGVGSRLIRAIGSRREFDIRRSFTDDGFRCEMRISFEDASSR